MITNFFLDEDLFIKNIDVTTQFSLFQKIGKILERKNYVTEEYIEAISKREKEYPTGIITSLYEVAIPHVDAKYAKVNTLYVLTSKEGIEFENSEDEGNLKAKIVFGIIIKDHDSHIDFLVQISRLLQNENILEKIYFAKDNKEIKQIIEKELKLS